MSTQYRLVQSGKTASGGCSAGPRFARAVAPRIYYSLISSIKDFNTQVTEKFAISKKNRRMDLNFRH
jgi:hypothetical protein